MLGDPQLRENWQCELDSVRKRIDDMRVLLVNTLHSTFGSDDFQFLNRQNGMFSYTGIKPEQVDRLRDDHGIYMLRSGRINVAGITEATVGRICDAWKAVT